MRKIALNTKRIQKEPNRVRSPVKRLGSSVSFQNNEQGDQLRAFSVFSRLIATALLFLFLLHPVATVFGADESVTEESPKAELEGVAINPSTEVIGDGPKTASASTEAASQEASQPPTGATETASVDSSQKNSIVAPEQQTLPTSTESIAMTDVNSSTTPSEDGIVGGSGSSAENVDTGTSSISNASSSVVAEGSDDAQVVETNISATTSEETATASSDNAEIATTSLNASTTQEVTVVMPEVNTQVNDQNRYQFGVNECVTVEGGFFYCSKNAVPKMTAEDKVYAAQDQDGDYEIFISKGGVDTQITHNLYDDSAPQYDAKSNRLVWHALINDRYQIIVYDFATNKMEQFTNEPYNSMQPAILGDRIVWQAWVNNNWEIVLDENGKRTQLTNNNTQDIAPHIRGDLVSWQSQTGDTRDITIYNIKTKEVEVIKGAGGTDASNPRFLLVYDSIEGNGDTKTVGYDLETGKTVPLSAIPQSVPKEIPEPDHSKEKVAFVQTSPTLKDEGEVADDTTGSSTDMGDTHASSTDVAPGDVVVFATSTTLMSTTTEPAHIDAVDMTPVATIGATPAAASTTIPDLVIPAFVNTESNAQ